VKCKELGKKQPSYI